VKNSKLWPPGGLDSQRASLNDAVPLHFHAPEIETVSTDSKTLRIGRHTDLVQLVYVSTAARDLALDELNELAERSRRNNLKARITGILLHQGASFYGVLEGDRTRVFQRMEIIISDGRHRDVQILREQEIRTRRFENWSLGAIPRSTARTGANDAADGLVRDLSKHLV
jgi:hypothetical protein